MGLRAALAAALAADLNACQLAYSMTTDHSSLRTASARGILQCSTQLVAYLRFFRASGSEEKLAPVTPPHQTASAENAPSPSENAVVHPQAFLHTCDALVLRRCARLLDRPQQLRIDRASDPLKKPGLSVAS